MDQSCGAILSVHPQIIHAFKIRGQTAIAVVDFTEIMEHPIKNERIFQTLDRFPGARFDVTVALPENTYVAEVVGVVCRMGIKEIRSAKVLDVFNLQDGNKAVTLRMEFRDAETTLDANFLP